MVNGVRFFCIRGVRNIFIIGENLQYINLKGAKNMVKILSMNIDENILKKR